MKVQVTSSAATLGGQVMIIYPPFRIPGVPARGHQGPAQVAQDWLLGHARQLMTYTALILGAYLAISGLAHLS
jgi:hypothetical protein